MDALPGVGHACGHNLIGIGGMCSCPHGFPSHWASCHLGVAVACALKTALEKHNISGKVVLLGTPAEEGGCGKFPLLDNGAYKEMDVCLM